YTTLFRSLIGKTTGRSASAASTPAVCQLLSLADLVDLGAAVWARADCCRLAVLHRDRLRVFHLNLSFVLQAVAFHWSPSLSEILVVGADPPILGWRICPRQPQFNLNSGRGSKNVPESGLEGVF